MSKLIDLTNQRFGRLTVLKRDKTKMGNYAYWICKCDCGNIISVRGNSLRNKITKSCGCLQREKVTIDLSGQKFERLKVLRRDNSKTDGYAYWICQCDCGNIVSVSSNNLRNGITKSCGCLKKEKTSEKNVIDLTGKKFGKLIVLKRDISKIGIEKSAYWLCQCDCGNIISVLGHNLRSGHTMSCGCYRSSKGEDKIKDILSFLKVNFIQQKIFNNLKYKNNLKFDFFLPDYNICIEYQGQQHYEVIEYFGGEKEFEEVLLRDNIKKQWCKDNNIKLVEIPYWDFQNINSDYILQRLQEAQS